MLIIAMETEKQGDEPSTDRYKMIDVLDELRLMKDRQAVNQSSLLVGLKELVKVKEEGELTDSDMSEIDSDGK